MLKGLFLSEVCAYNVPMSNGILPPNTPIPADWFDDAEDDGAPCCPDPECPGRYGTCTFPGYADNH